MKKKGKLNKYCFSSIWKFTIIIELNYLMNSTKTVDFARHRIGNTFQITCFASTTSCRVWISRKAGSITRSIADIPVNERFHSEKNSLAYHHWLLTFSSLSIIEIMWQIYMRGVTSSLVSCAPSFSSAIYRVVH